MLCISRGEETDRGPFKCINTRSTKNIHHLWRDQHVYFPPVSKATCPFAFSIQIGVKLIPSYFFPFLVFPRSRFITLGVTSRAGRGQRPRARGSSIDFKTVPNHSQV
jgi:hypothetical protein